MRIVVDIQSLQSAGSANRGIGRYSRALIEAMLDAAPKNEFILLMNGLIGEDNDRIRREFTSRWSNVIVRVWTACVPAGFMAPTENRLAAEAIREAVIEDCAADIVLITSLFEGFDDDCVVTVSRTPTFVVLYDLIPLIFPNIYLSEKRVREFYSQKIENLKTASHMLAISDCSAQDGVKYLYVPKEIVTNISSDVSKKFKQCEMDTLTWSTLAEKFDLSRPFLMYTGGIDHRKNIYGLISAFASLPEQVITNHQLAIVCNVSAIDKARLLKHAQMLGLPNDAVVMTGYVSDDALVSLYNACKAFVFPSWYEGFGLPVLEAMRCGAAVIGANVSSVPEVIGREDCLFDPHSTEDMAAKIEKVLTDEPFRQALREHASVQAARFSWAQSADQALAAMKAVVAQTQIVEIKGETLKKKPRLAFVSPLPPERSGISFYSAELLPDLAKYYDIDLISEQKEVSDEIKLQKLPVRDTEWLRKNSQHYDRVLYQFGNSTFHSHMFDLLAEVPGVVVLHDFFLSNIERHLNSSRFTRLMGETHGYHAVLDRFNQLDGRDGETEAVHNWPVNARAIKEARGVIVHSKYSQKLARRFYDELTVSDWSLINLFRIPYFIGDTDRQHARDLLGFKEDDLLICSFGYVTPSKLPLRLIDGLISSTAASNEKVKMVFVGNSENISKSIFARISKTPLEGRIHITGWISDDFYRYYLQAADMAIQLRTNSRGESSASVLDCQNHGLPTIVNENGSMADIQENTVIKIPDHFSDAELAEAIDLLVTNHEIRAKIGAAARYEIKNHHSPDKCSFAYYKAIERFYEPHKRAKHDLVKKLAKLEADPVRDVQLAQAVADSFNTSPRLRQLFVDVSFLAREDANTGIQRVGRAILGQWLNHPPAGWRIEPVFSDSELGRFRYARKFTCGFLDVPDDWAEDVAIDYFAHDQFVGLDLNGDMNAALLRSLSIMAASGVKISFVVYDILPILMPDKFAHGDVNWFKNWLDSVSRFEHLICISRAVADDLESYLDHNPPANGLSPDISWFHLVADIENATTRVKFPHIEKVKIAELGSFPRFLMVGTIEPRKGYAFVLDAFEQFWSEGGNAALIIVGKQGWKVDALCDRLKRHPEKSKRLIWVERCTDAQLSELYSSSSCMIAASEGEGFGLPLIEAARYGLPILARDIPVFKEVAGAHATYFHGERPENLCDALKAWISADQAGSAVQSEKMPFLSWKESANALLRNLSIVD